MLVLEYLYKIINLVYCLLRKIFERAHQLITSKSVFNENTLKAGYKWHNKSNTVNKWLIVFGFLLIFAFLKFYIVDEDKHRRHFLLLFLGAYFLVIIKFKTFLLLKKIS